MHVVHCKPYENTCMRLISKTQCILAIKYTAYQLNTMQLYNRKKKTWWQLASRYCWNRARLWHASELVSFLVGLRIYQHPGIVKTTNECKWDPIKVTFLLHFVISYNCLTTWPKPLPKRTLHTVRSKASSFKWEHRLLYLTFWSRNYFYNFSTPCI